MAFTNNITGASATDGLLIGINTDGRAILNQQENLDLSIRLGAGIQNVSRIHINGEAGATQGFIGLGNSFDEPQSLLHVDARLDATGEVFRTNTRGLNSFWRKTIADEEKGAIFSRVVGGPEVDRDNFSIQATENDITFHTQPMTTIDGIGTERMRIVGVNRPFENVDDLVQAGNVGIITRNPLTKLYIGGETSLNAGYRQWMDIGTFYNSYDNQGFDNMYVGLQRRGWNAHDAIINWGNDPTGTGTVDRLRFVFTANFFANVPASGEEGLEIARMVSDGTVGRMGVGDFLTINEDPTHTLDIIGNARIRQVPEGEFDQFLVIDDEGVLHWRDIPIPPTPTDGMLGNECGLDSDHPDYNPLISHWEIPMEKFNFVFSGQGEGVTNVGIGIHTCTPKAKLEVLQEVEEQGISSLISAPLDNTRAIFGYAKFGNDQIGILGQARNPNGVIRQRGIKGYAWNEDNEELEENIGVDGIAEGAGELNIGIQGRGVDWAGRFIGDVAVTGELFEQTSDEMFKENITNITDGLGIVRNLKPRTFNFKTEEYDYMNFSEGTKFGLIAQEVDTILPEIVKDNIYHAQYDTLGNIISPALDFKALNYSGLIPITISAVQELDNELTSVIEKLPPSRPALISPENGSTDIPTAVTATWHSVENADYYTISVYSIDRGKPFEFRANTSDTTLSGVVPYYCCTYEWYVIAHNEHASSAPSETWSFTTADPVLDAPVLVSPATGDSISIRTSFVWESVENAQYYNFYISSSELEQDIIHHERLYYDTIALPRLDISEGEYYWWVTAENDCGVFSDKSEVRSFVLISSISREEPILSDNKYKTNQMPILNALEKTMQLEGKYFKWDTENYPEINDTSRQIGLIAQEVLEIIPEAVKTNLKGDYGVEYNRLVAVLIEAIKEQQLQISQLENNYQSQIDELQDNLNSLIEMVYNCCQTSDKSNDNDDEKTGDIISPNFTQSIKLKDQKAIVLNQNVPNPFKEQTTITFQIPIQVNSASIIFIDNLGNIINQVEIHDRGYGELVVYAQDLSAGLYTYYLVADGKTIASKKMVLSK